MYPTQPQAPLLPPPARLALAPDLLEPRGFADWMMSPWLSEKLRALVLPLQVEDLRVLLAWDGSATVRLFQDGAVRLQGRTSAFGSVLTTTRSGSRTTIRGFQDDQTVDYTVDEVDDEIRVEGDTGRFRSRYILKFSGPEVSLSGDHGEFDSNYTARCEGDMVHVEGIRSGERIDCRVVREGHSLMIDGAVLGTHSELSLTMSDKEWNLVGFALGEKLSLALRLVEDGIEVSGALPPQGLANYKLVRTGEGLWVRGKVNNYHVNYRLLTNPVEHPAHATGEGAPPSP